MADGTSKIKRTLDSLKAVFSLITDKEKKQLKLLVPVMVISALLEMLGLGVIVWLCSVILDADMLQGRFTTIIADILHLTDTNQILMFICIALLCIYLFKLPYMIWGSYKTTKFVQNAKHSLATKLAKIIIKKPYSFFLEKNNTDIQSLLGQDMTMFTDALNATMQIIKEGLVAAGMAIALLILNPTMVLFVILGGGGMIFLTRHFLMKKAEEVSKISRVAQKARWEWLTRMSQGIKDIKIGKREPYFISKFVEADEEATDTAYIRQFCTRLPTVCIENIMILTVLLYILVLLLLSQRLSNYIPSLAGLLWAAMKLFPSFNRINIALMDLDYSRPSLDEITSFLNTKDEQQINEAKTGEKLELKNIDYKYPSKTENTLENINLIIEPKTSIGIIGESGAGKTTLLNIILGLSHPTDGYVYVPKAKQPNQTFAYVPQETFLFDSTIRENIIMSENEKDNNTEKIWQCLADAEIANLVKSLPEGLDTKIGDRGIRLSGGERQRLGLARALYQNPDIIIFDEATSALDLDTEEKIVKTLNKLKSEKTLILVSHRKSTLSGCDKIYKIKNKTIEEIK